MSRQEGQLAALFDIVVGDRFAIDHDGNGLRMRRRGPARQGQCRSTSQDQDRRPMRACSRHDHIRYINRFELDQ